MRTADLSKGFRQGGAESTQPKKNGPSEFPTLSHFMRATDGADRAFFPEEQADRFLPTCCGMANGIGGWIVMGAQLEEEELTSEGIFDPLGLERRLQSQLRNTGAISADPVEAFHHLDDEGKALLIARVRPAEWFRRPVTVGDRGVYRRVEGENLLSGQRVRFRLSLDALERLRCDLPVPDLELTELHAESVADFRECVTRSRPQWKALSEVDFLKRTLALDPEGAVTRAGHLLLGKNGARVRVTVHGPEGHEDIFEVRNLWRASTDLLPRMSAELSAPCASALRECFLNALIHAEHDEGPVLALRRSDTFFVENPGLSRATGPATSESRNYRLMRMFVMAGCARGEGSGLTAVRAFDPDFVFGQDTLDLATFVSMRLEKAPAQPEEQVEGAALFREASDRSSPLSEADRNDFPVVPPALPQPESVAPPPKKPEVANPPLPLALPVAPEGLTAADPTLEATAPAGFAAEGPALAELAPKGLVLEDLAFEALAITEPTLEATAPAELAPEGITPAGFAAEGPALAELAPAELAPEELTPAGPALTEPALEALALEAPALTEPTLEATAPAELAPEELTPAGPALTEPTLEALALEAPAPESAARPLAKPEVENPPLPAPPTPPSTAEGERHPPPVRPAFGSAADDLEALVARLKRPGA